MCGNLECVTHWSGCIYTIKKTISCLFLKNDNSIFEKFHVKNVYVMRKCLQYGCFLEATLCDNGGDITLYKNICLTLSISKVFVLFLFQEHICMCVFLCSCSHALSMKYIMSWSVEWRRVLQLDQCLFNRVIYALTPHVWEAGHCALSKCLTRESH